MLVFVVLYISSEENQVVWAVLCGLFGLFLGQAFIPDGALSCPLPESMSRARPGKCLNTRPLLSDLGVHSKVIEIAGWHCLYSASTACIFALWRKACRAAWESVLMTVLSDRGSCSARSKGGAPYVGARVEHAAHRLLLWRPGAQRAEANLLAFPLRNPLPPPPNLSYFFNCTGNFIL